MEWKGVEAYEWDGIEGDALEGDALEGDGRGGISCKVYTYTY